VTGAWLGVFSALDVARALDGLPFELDIAKIGADKTTVDMAMKPEGTVPTCKLTDTIRDALSTLDIFGQNAVLVKDDSGKHRLITPRCAVQALAEGVPPNCSIAAWLQSRQTPDEPREVLRGSPLVEAAKVMTAQSLHHLLVVEFPGARPIGVLSSLDLVRGVVSMRHHCPFVSLGWLRLLGSASSRKRLGTMWAGGIDPHPASSRPRTDLSQ